MRDRYVECECCEGFILVESDRFCTDTYYEINDDTVCDDCILDYIKQFRK